MQVAELEVHNKSGLHARPAATFVKMAAGYRSKVSVENVTRGAAGANAKSLLAVLGCGVEMGHTIRVSAEGDDEEAAIAALCALAEDGFGEAVAG
jgi:phosphotransferase system HPr (HPr) family protein